jgi:hypothetical protein
MPRPSFFNDNEYRAYPFIYADRLQTLPTLIEKTVVDAGFILGLDADFDDEAHSVWLSSVYRSGTQVSFIFKTDAPGAIDYDLNFTCATNTKNWQTIYSNTAPANVPCATEPVWEGFITISNAQELVGVGDGGSLNFSENEYQIEQARMQNLAKSYLRSINVGNYERTQPNECGDDTAYEKKIIANARCLQGDIRFKEGYQAIISQNNNSNTITFSAGIGNSYGQPIDADFCAAGSELPLYEGEPLAENGKFYARGPACDELIFSINGIGGPSVSILGGVGISITATENENELKLTRQPNTQNSCNQDTTNEQ